MTQSHDDFLQSLTFNLSADDLWALEIAVPPGTVGTLTSEGYLLQYTNGVQLVLTIDENGNYHSRIVS